MLWFPPGILGGVSPGSQWDAVSVRSSCCNKVPHTGRLFNNRRLFFTVLEAGRPRLVCPQTQRAAPCSQMAPSRCALTWCKGQGVSLGPLSSRRPRLQHH